MVEFKLKLKNALYLHPEIDKEPLHTRDFSRVRLHNNISQRKDYKMYNKNKKRMTPEEFGEAYEKFLDICDILASNLEDGEYYETCEEIFNGIERKELDVSNIVTSEEYQKLKRSLIESRCGGVPIGDVPTPKYNTKTAEGCVAFHRDNPDMYIVF